MELRHLRYFCAVAEHRSFTSAARLLNVSQSGVSGQVRALEEEMGVRLLRRNPREVSLTPEGVIFYEEAREILGRTQRAVEMTLRASKGQSGRLSVGLCGPVTVTFLSRLVRKFRRQYPGVVVGIVERPPAEQIEALLEGQIDIAFTRGLPAEKKHLVCHQLLFREPLMVALPKGHRLAGSEAIALEQIATERMALFAREGAPEVFDAIVSLCQKAKFSPRIVDTPRSWQALLTVVEANEVVAVVPQCVKHLQPNEVVFLPIMGKSSQLDAIVAWRREDVTVAQKGFLEMMWKYRDGLGRLGDPMGNSHGVSRRGRAAAGKTASGSWPG